MSVTYVVNDEEERFADIFTLTHKAIWYGQCPEKENSMLRIIGSGNGCISCFGIIAQFGKNYAVNNGMSIKGIELMDCTMSVLHDAQEMVGGGLAYLECEEDNEKAYDFYDRCGFKEFDRRYSQTDDYNYILMRKIF